MTYAQALMVVRNPQSGYSPAKIREAVAFILGSLDASDEDIADAGHALDYARPRVSFAAGARYSELDESPFSGAISAGEY